MSGTTAQRRAAAFASVGDYAVFLAIFAFVSLHWLTGFKALPWDAMDEFYPVSRFVAQSLAEGHWPWWNP